MSSLNEHAAHSTGRWCAAATAALLALTLGAAPRAQQKIPPGSFGHNVEVVGYTDLGGRPGFKLAIQEVGGRWYLYTGGFWVRGWNIVDVTNPAAPKVEKFVPGPHNTSTVQMDWAGNGRMETPLSRIPEGRDFDETKPYEGGFYMWDLKDPLNPRKVGQWKSPGTHRNFYDGGTYVYATSQMDGYEGQILVIVDVSDMANPREVGRWWAPGQHVAAGEKPSEPGISLHGPAYPVGHLLYAGFGSAGVYVLDISDVAHPKPIGNLDFSPPFKSGNVTHSVLPLPDRRIALVNSEAGPEYCKEGLNHASIVDISDPTKLWLISTLPRPLPPPGYPVADFCDKGRFGPHNINLLQHSRFVEKQGNILYLTYFTAGLRIYDIADPRAPKEIGYFIPPDPVKRYGPLPAGALVTDTEDVLVDSRGCIYITDRNQGVWILRYTGPKSRPTTEP